LLAYGSLCTGIRERVNLKDFGEYVIFGIKSEDEDTARVACGVVSYIAAAFGE